MRRTTGKQANEKQKAKRVKVRETIKNKTDK